MDTAGVRCVRVQPVCCSGKKEAQKNCAGINSISSFSSFAGILLPLFAAMQPPDLVSHIFVLPGDGFPFDI